MVVLRKMLLVLMSVWSMAAFGSNATLEIDRLDVEKDETINAVFTYKGQLTSEPDFSVLEEDFTIISQGLSKSVEIINGNYREQQTWNTVLLPKREGTLVVPAVQFGNEQSKPVTLTVRPSAPRSDKDLGDLFLEVELTPQTPGYVQQQHIFTVRLFYRGWLLDGQLSDPQLGNQDIVVQSLGEPRRYSTTRNGERYQVYERRHALFPQASGPMAIGDTTFSGRLRLPVGGNRLKSVSAPGVTAEVRPVPAGYSGDVWLPASSVTMNEVWPSDTLVFEQGVPITRTINVNAQGLTSAQLPAMKLEGNESVRVYPDLAKTQDRVGEMGFVGTLSLGAALVPQQPGELTLPPVELVWWDTTTDQQRTARLESRTISVRLPAGTSNEAAVNQTGALASTTAKTWQGNPWFYATLACALGWLVTGLLRFKRRNTVSTTTYASSQPSSKSLHARLKKACANNDAKACGHLLGQFLRDPEDTSPESIDSELVNQRRALNQFLYGPNSEVDSWQGGQQLWRAIQQARRSKTPRRNVDTEVLARLAP